jgi:hypothetical protein
MAFWRDCDESHYGKNSLHELGQLIPQVDEPIAVKPWG